MLILSHDHYLSIEMVKVQV